MLNFILSSILTIGFNVVSYHYYQILKIILFNFIYFNFKLTSILKNKFIPIPIAKASSAG